MRFRPIGVMLGAWLLFLGAPEARHAQENFPTRSIRIVIPYSPGSVADVVFARIVAQNMQERWKATIVVEIEVRRQWFDRRAEGQVARSAPDG